MQRVDFGASVTLERLEAERQKPRDAKTVTNWSRFVMSLVYRSPRNVDNLRLRLRESDYEAKVEQAYQQARNASDPPTYADFVAREAGNLEDEAHAYLIRRVIDSKWIGGHLNNMIWHIGEVNLHDDLLLGDCPIITSDGIGHQDGFLILPIGPNKFFLATNERATRDYFLAENKARRLARALNDATVRQADALVLGAFDSHKRFIESRLASVESARSRERITWSI